MTFDERPDGRVVDGPPRADASHGEDAALGLPERRRNAVMAAIGELSRPGAVDPDSWMPAIAVRRFTPGGVVIALGGTLDREGLEPTRTLLDRLAREDLVGTVLDMTGVTRCSPGMARVLARWRIRLLARGVRVDLRGAPGALAAEMGLHHDGF